MAALFVACLPSGVHGLGSYSGSGKGMVEVKVPGGLRRN